MAKPWFGGVPSSLLSAALANPNLWRETPNLSR